MATDLFDVEADSSPDDDGTGEFSLVLRVFLQPGAGPTAVLGRRKDALALRVALSPGDPRTGGAVENFLAELLSIDPERVELVAGARGAEKRFRIRGVSAEALRRQLDDEIARATRGRAGARGGRVGR